MTCRMALRLAGDLLVGVHFGGRSNRSNNVRSGPGRGPAPRRRPSLLITMRDSGPVARAGHLLRTRAFPIGRWAAPDHPIRLLALLGRGPAGSFPGRSSPRFLGEALSI